jgi:hypothetical protein
MTDIRVKLVQILFVILFSPFLFIYYFLIWQLPKRFGFVKRWAIVFCYILIFAVDTYLLSEGIINVLVFILIPMTMLIYGLFYFKDEFRERLKKICWKLKNE